MASAYQHYLTPEDLAMLSRALSRVQQGLKLDPDSEESKLIASSMIAKFQKSPISEDELVAIFLNIGELRNQHRA